MIRARSSGWLPEGAPAMNGVWIWWIAAAVLIGA
jgi:hypothetical protein